MRGFSKLMNLEKILGSSLNLWELSFSYNLTGNELRQTGQKMYVEITAAAPAAAQITVAEHKFAKTHSE